MMGHLLVSDAFAQQPPRVFAGSSPSTVLLDVGSLTDGEIAEVMKLLAATTSRDSWQNVTVQPGDSLFGIVNQQYRFSDRAFPLTAKSLADVIASENGLSTVLPEGRELRIPVLPVRPFGRGARSDLAQVFFAQEGMLATATPNVNSVLDLSSTFTQAGEPVEQSPEKRDGLTWALKDLPEPALRTLAAMSVRGGRRPGYVGPTDAATALLTNVGTAPVTSQPSWPEPTESVRQLVAQIPAAQRRKYYILDNFAGRSQGPCTHGAMVLQVARDTLTQFGASSEFIASVAPVELDFYANVADSRKIVEAYAHEFTQNIERQLLAILTLLIQREPASRETLTVPALYVAALYHGYLESPDTDMISTSYYTFYDGFSWLPLEYTAESPLSLLTAVLNDDGSFVENSVYRKRVPLREFYDRRNELGVFLVGAEESPGKPFGMYSQNGDGVTLVGRGAGWGTSGSCLAKERGTSFATPNVAAQLLLARAFWRWKELPVSSLDLKLRALLATDLETAYVGRYAAAGRLNLEKLLQTKGMVAHRQSGEVVQVESLTPARIWYRRDGLERRVTLNWGDDGTDVLGVYVVQQTAYILQKFRPMWTKIDATRVDMRLRDGTHEHTITTVQELESLYRELFVL
jgi:hypothetical protein